MSQLREIFDREHISVDILAEMGHEDLKQIGITAFGHRHKLIKGLEKLLSGNGESYRTVSLSMKRQLTWPHPRPKRRRGI